MVVKHDPLGWRCLERHDGIALSMPPEGVGTGWLFGTSRYFGEDASAPTDVVPRSFSHKMYPDQVYFEFILYLKLFAVHDIHEEISLNVVRFPARLRSHRRPPG